jgi:hypothetical protein
LNKTPEEIRDEKSILKAIVIQSLTPVFCCVPAAFTTAMILSQGSDLTALNMTIFRYGENQKYRFTVPYLSAAIIGVIPILDPFITLRVVKSYRNAANEFLTKFKIYRKLTGARLEETVAEVVPVRPRLRRIVPPS